MRNARPMTNVNTIPARKPARWPRLIDCNAQCIVKLEVTRIAVLTPATKTGNSYCPAVQTPPAGGSLQGGQNCHASGRMVDASGLTTRMKKYAAKNDPKSMISEPMKRQIPRVRASTAELSLASGG